MYDGSYSSQDNSAFQIGLKSFDAFGLKNLFFQLEYNRVNGLAYYNVKYSSQNYSHYNQSLTTPALFPQEFIGLISYSYKRVFIQLKKNVSVADAYGLTQYVNYFDGKIGYMINPHYNFNISVGSTLRTNSIWGINTKPQEMQLFYVSLRTSLYNLYYDF